MIEYLKIKDFAPVITGGTPSTTKNEYWNGGIIPWLNSGELNQDIITLTRNYITQQGLDNSSTRLMPPNSVLIALTGSTTGVVGYLTFEACANQSVTGILPSEKHVPKYLYYFLKSIRKKIVSEAYGGAQPHISQGYVKDLQIPLPPLPQQQKIANILDAADVLRQKDKALLAKYDELTQALFLDMFGDPVSNPKGWEKVELKKLGKVITGSTPPSSKENMFGGDIPFVTPGDLDKILPYKRFVTKEGSSNSRTVNKGSLFVCCIGATIGKTGMARELSAFNQQINAIEWSSIINSLFGFNCFYSLKKELIEKAISTTLPIMKKSEFEKLKMISPPIIVQNQFAERVQIIEQQKAIAQKSLEKSEHLFNSLLQKAFKGELL